MTELNPGPADKDKLEDTPDIADTMHAGTGKKATPATRRKSRIGAWLFLLLIFIGLPAAWFAAPPDIRQQAMALLDTEAQQARQPIASHPTGQSSSLPMAAINDNTPPADEAVPRQPKQEDNTPPAASEAPAETALSSAPAIEDETAPLRDEITRLQAQTGSLRTERDHLQQQLLSGKNMQQRTLLGLLAGTDTRLTQRAALWADLAALPALSGPEQERAGKMATLMKHDVEQIEAWRKSLSELAEGIPEIQQADILPKPDNQYFAWLVGSFHLRPAPTQVEQQHSGLRRQLLDMAHALSLEDWPEPRAWRQLLGMLREQLGENAGPELPESLREISGDIETSRTAAADWMETL